MFYKLINEIKSFKTIFEPVHLKLNKFNTIKFKHQFKHLNFYSMPESILITLRRRLLNIFLFVALLFIFIFSTL